MEDLSTFRKRLLYQSQHRGMREMDFLLGTFGERLQTMERSELKEFEFLLSFPDQTLYSIFFNDAPLPKGVSKSLVKEVLAFKKI